MTWRHKKFLLMRKKVWCQEMLLPSCKIMLFLSNFFDFLSTTLELSVFLYFSVPQCQGWIWLFSIRGSKLNNLSTKRQSPCQIWIVEQQNHPFFANWTDWVLSLHSLLWLLDNLSVHLSLDSTAPFGRPSASVKFLHSLTLPHYYHCISTWPCPKHNSRRHSL